MSSTTLIPGPGSMWDPEVLHVRPNAFHASVNARYARGAGHRKNRVIGKQCEL